MLDIIPFLPAKRKRAPSGWWSFNAPCCHHRGHKPDARQRGGLIQHGDEFNFHCFNCGFKTGFKPGDSVSFRLRQLLIWLGVDEATVEMLNLEAMRYRSLYGMVAPTPIVPAQIDYQPVSIPEGFQLIDVDNPDHSRYTEYLTERAIDPHSYPFMVNPNAVGRTKSGILIPFTHDGMIVGYSTRHLDGRIPKYIHQHPHGYVFGTDLQRESWRKVIVVEGVLDALAIDGVALMHNDVNDLQFRTIASLHREVIVVPDRDSSGMTLVDRAMSYGWAVSFPDWGPDVKDVADAVKTYGRLNTLITIVGAAETSSLKIKLKRKAFA